MSMVELFEGHVREALTHPITPKLLGQLGTAIGMIELAKAVQNLDINVVASGMNSKITFSPGSNLGLDRNTLTQLLRVIEEDLTNCHIYLDEDSPDVRKMNHLCSKLRTALDKLDFE